MKRKEQSIRAAIGHLNAALEDMTTGAARSTFDIMRRFESANLVERVDAFLLGRSDFNLRSFVNGEMGRKLGRFIAEKIDFVSKAVPPKGDEFFFRSSGAVEFRAEVYVLTREQFESALHEAYRAGQ